MVRYIKKPLPVNAVQWFKDGDHPMVIGLCKYNMIVGPDETPVKFIIQTPEGGMIVSPGDWIVGPGYDGEYWPVKDKIFRATYEVYTDPNYKGEM